jgi:hypothetical protein
MFPKALFGVFALLAVVVSFPQPSRAVDFIIFEELKEIALRSGKISQRFVTCKIEPPYPVRTAFLKYARHQGAGPGHLDLLSKQFDEGAARVRNLKTGFSPEECKAKLETPEGVELLERIGKWGGS